MKRLKYIHTVLVIILFLNIGCTESKKQTKAEKQGWKLSMQSYTLHRFSLIEALDKTTQLGVTSIEVFPGQKISSDSETDKFTYQLGTEKRKEVLEYAKSKNIKLTSTGVMKAPREEWDSIFAFAKEMGMEYISAEPAFEDWDLIEQLAIKYNVKVAVHNHPNEKSYWKPEILLDHIQHRSKLLGACVDIGHYKRMGIDPIPGLRKLEGRIISLHMKDVLHQPDNDKYEDVVWGSGELDVREVLKELKRQNFKGYFTIEYEAKWNNNLPEIKESIDYFNDMANEIL